MYVALRCWLTVLIGVLLLATACSLFAQQSSGAYKVQITQIRQREFPKFDIYFTVSDSAGNLIDPQHAGLKIRAKPEDLIEHQSLHAAGPIYAALVVDISSSMSYRFKEPPYRRRIDVVINALNQYIDKMNPEDRCVLVPFGTTVPVISSLTWLTREEARAQVRKLPTESGPSGNWRTPEERQAALTPDYLDYHVSRLYDGIDTALDFVISQQAVASRMPLIVLTDGYDDSYSTMRHTYVSHNLEGKLGLQAVLTKAQKSGIVLDCVGIGVAGNPAPNAEDRLGNDEQKIKRYNDMAAVFVDTEALQKLVQVNRSGVEPLITQDAKELESYYPQMLARFHKEWKIQCEGYTDLHQDLDAEFYVEVTDTHQAIYRSNSVKVPFQAPTWGETGYSAWLLKKFVVFAVLLFFSMLAWFLPELLFRSSMEKVTPSVRGTVVAPPPNLVTSHSNQMPNLIDANSGQPIVAPPGAVQGAAAPVRPATSKKVVRLTGASAYTADDAAVKVEGETPPGTSS